MRQDLESLIAEVEGAMRPGWQWLLRSRGKDDTWKQKYFAHIFFIGSIGDKYNSHKGLGDDPYEALRGAFEHFRKHA